MVRSRSRGKIYMEDKASRPCDELGKSTVHFQVSVIVITILIFHAKLEELVLTASR